MPKAISKLSVVILLALAVVVVSIFAGLLAQRWYIVDVKTIPIEVTVINDSLIGFNTGTDKLYFGTTVPGGMSGRKATLTTSYDSIVTISVEGQVEGWVSVSENNIRLRPNDNVDINFQLAVPDAAMPGNYTGTAIIRYKRALPWQ